MWSARTLNKQSRSSCSTQQVLANSASGLLAQCVTWYSSDLISKKNAVAHSTTQTLLLVRATAHACLLIIHTPPPRQTNKNTQTKKDRGEQYLSMEYIGVPGEGVPLSSSSTSKWCLSLLAGPTFAQSGNSKVRNLNSIS